MKYLKIPIRSVISNCALPTLSVNEISIKENFNFQFAVQNVPNKIRENRKREKTWVKCEGESRESLKEKKNG